MNWHCIQLTRLEFHSGELAILQGAFREAFVARGGPRGMALFGCWAEDGLCYRVYATPASERCLKALLLAYSARRCEPPGLVQELDFIGGDAEFFSSLVC